MGILKHFIDTTRCTFFYLARAYGRKSFTCNICGYKGCFWAFGFPPRLNAMCPHCRSFERHRLLILADRNVNYLPASAFCILPLSVH